MRKLFTVDDILVAAISAIGDSFGEVIAKASGWPMPICGALSLGIGMLFQKIIDSIAYSEAVQRKPKNKIYVYLGFILLFLVIHVVVAMTMRMSLIEYAMQGVAFTIGIPIVGFILNLCLRGFRIWKIRQRYGDGSEGYILSLTDEQLEKVNNVNQPIEGEFDIECAVKTKNGVYVGYKYEKTICYLGIPYAKPPVGRLRWKAPQPLPESNAVFEAQYFGASAIQVEYQGSIIKNLRQSEDCLTVNVCVHEEKTDSLKPVLVLFHNGDFTSGGSVDPLLYGDRLVDNNPDVVFVSFNSRLGIFGYIDFSEIPGGEDYPDTLNLGLLDQIAALKWIKENIAAFGGDPDRITVIGFDANACSILLLAACSQAKGLFQKAFVFNGSLDSAYDTPETARALAKSLLKETKTSTMEELMQLDTETLKKAAQNLWQIMCAPTCDGTLIPANVFKLYQEGAANDVEFIIGIPKDAMKAYKAVVGRQNFADGVAVAMGEMKKYMDASTWSKVQAYIDTKAASSSDLEAKANFIEQWIELYDYRSAVKLAEGGNQVHLLYWNEKALIEKLGSSTADVLGTLLGNGEAMQMYGSVMNEDMSEVLQKFLVKFMKGEALELYTNEIRGIEEIKWYPFPEALIVSDGELECDRIEDKITEIKEFHDFALS